ncbi:MAG: SDR family oxidoreductase [Cyclobacteriaceae bacterium]|nr:SDR family oxidoreductase [Cyclobacteriaceae bacterium]
MRKTIVVCGTSRGIGRELVSVLSKVPEIRVVALSRNIDGIQREYARATHVEWFAYDLEKDASEQLKQILPALGPIHALINNAGYLEKGLVQELSIEAYRRCLQVNFLGPVALIKALHSKLSEGKAHVVNISTMGAFQGSAKFPGLSAYAASKAALTNFTEVFSEEQKATGIRMNCLCLGAVNTEMLREAFPGYEAPTSPEEMAKYIAEFTLNNGNLFNGKILAVSSSTP